MEIFNFRFSLQHPGLMTATCETMPAAAAKKTVNNGKAVASNPECEPTDAELVIRSQNGDTEAFDELVTRYRGKVYAMIVNMIHNDADAWDLAQDAFVKAWKALPRFEARSNFYTWLYRIAHNVTYDWLRKKKVRGDGAEFDDAIQADVEPGAPTAGLTVGH